MTTALITTGLMLACAIGFALGIRVLLELVESIVEFIQ